MQTLRMMHNFELSSNHDCSTLAGRLAAHLLRIPLRHKGKLVAVFTAVVITTLLVTVVTPRTYRSEGKLLLRLGRENMALDPTATLGSTPLLTIQQSRENEINSVIEIMRSRVLMEKVVDALGPARIMGRDPTVSVDREDAIRKLIRSLDVEAVRKSNVLEITYDATSPELRASSRRQSYRLFSGRAHPVESHCLARKSFWTNKPLAFVSDCKIGKEKLRAMKDETGLTSPDSRKTIIVTRIGRLEDELLQNKATLASKDAEVKQLQKQLVDLPATQVTEQTVGFANEAADGMRQQLYTLQLREKELASRVTDDHPQLIEVREQIADAQSVLGQEKPERTQTKTGINKSHEEIKMQLLKEEPVRVSLVAKCERLATQLAAEQSIIGETERRRTPGDPTAARSAT